MRDQRTLSHERARSGSSTDRPAIREPAKKFPAKWIRQNEIKIVLVRSRLCVCVKLSWSVLLSFTDLDGTNTSTCTLFRVRETRVRSHHHHQHYHYHGSWTSVSSFVSNEHYNMILLAARNDSYEIMSLCFVSALPSVSVLTVNNFFSGSESCQ